jgi:hypothetical protein
LDTLSLFRVTGGLELTSALLDGNLSGIWLAALDDFRNWLIREAA